MVMHRLDLRLESNPNDWRSLGSNSQPLVYKDSSFTTRPRGLLCFRWYCLNVMTFHMNNVLNPLSNCNVMQYFGK